MRFALLAALVTARLFAAPALTTIQDILYKADGTRFDGVAQIEWKSFQTADGAEIPQQTISVRVTNGNLRIALAPTSNAPKPINYTVKFNSDGRTQFVEYWLVPPSSTPLRLKDVRTVSQVGNVTTGGPSTINDVTGLRAELDIRPQKGGAFANSKAAVINSTGAIDAAIGSASDCVHVDGSAGPCGSSALVFVDGELPTGAINGTNATFTLSTAPSPVASLNLFRNGILMRQGIGYTVSGNTITVAAGSIPGTGDILQAWYRLPSTGASTLQFNENETPAGVVDGSNATFTLAAAPVPASSLQIFRNGVLQKSGVDFLLSTNVVTFVTAAVPNPGDILQASYRR